VLLVVGHVQLRIAVDDPKQQQALQRQPQQQQIDDLYEDHYCTACNGKMMLRCPHCQRGAVSDDTTVVNVTATPFGPLKTVDTVAVQRRCSYCGGTGFIKCPYCVGGIDRGGFVPDTRGPRATSPRTPNRFHP
jgi:hypothetical protein